MSFETKNIYSKGNGVRYSYTPKKKFSQFTLKWDYDKELLKKRILGGTLAFGLIFAFWLTKNVLQDLPDISSINSMVFSEATDIQDRNWKSLYKLYEQNREYVVFSGISKNMINAIVAVEDQRYRDHNGLDPLGILRAGVSNVFHPGRGLQGASTIPQQLVRNLLLFKGQTFMEKVTRKLKEMLLTSKLDSVLENQIEKTSPNLSSDELRKQMKNKILELYLNYISFWNNAYWVESASKIYFDKSAKDLDVFEASILWSIPKGPSVYNPYKNPAKLVWEFIVKNTNGEKVALTGDMTKKIQALFSEKLMNVSIAKKDSEFVKTLESLWHFGIVWSAWESLQVTYIPGRKDSAITRMYEDDYITENEAKQAFLEGITYKFRRNKIDMLAPHFVQWIVDVLEKQYDKETLLKWGIVVKTTLDYNIQLVAENALTGNMPVLQQNGANNSSMIYLDSQNGDVLAYVGSLNYFDEGIQGQNDMVRKPRQSGSSIKPFIYALGFEKLPLTLDTPIYDIPFQIGPDRPNNADDKFSGLLPLRLALAHSRNITSAKMLLALWGEEVAKPYLISLGLSGVQMNTKYGYTLALGAAEVSMLDLANAYMHLSTTTPGLINPILEIRARDGSLIYQKEVVKQPEVVKPGISFLIRKILSEPANRLAGWVSKFNVQWLSLAIKTGTSNAKTDKWNRPRDGWLASYNASRVALFWAGNADATPLNKNAYGGTIQADPMKRFYTELLKNNYITNDPIKQVDVSSVTISKLSGKISNGNIPQDLTVNTMYFSKWLPLLADEWVTPIDYDSSCNGALSQLTPAWEVKKWYVFNPVTFMPSKMDIADIIQWYRIGSSFSGESKSSYGSGNVTYNFNNIFPEIPTKACEARQVKQDTSIGVDFILPQAWGSISQKFSLGYNIQSSKPLDRVVIFADDKQIAQYPGKGKQTLNEVQSISSSLSAGSHKLTVMAVDKEWFSNTKDITVTVVASDTKAPTVVQDKISAKKLDSGKYQVTIVLQDDLSTITKWSVSKNGAVLASFGGNVVSFETDDLTAVQISANDAYNNKLETTVQIPQ